MQHSWILAVVFGFFTFPALAQNTTDGSAAIAHNPQPFGLWLGDFKAEALEEGISQATLDDAFAATAPIERIVALDRKQPESVLTLAQYLKNTVTPKRIEQGRQLLAEHKVLLDTVSKQYGVQPRFIVALWGIETNFGSNTGGFRTVDALATLAYDGRRSDYFREELLNALRILQEEHIPADEMQGSWAGALGQCQFMPSSFLRFAVDYDKDGTRDLWNSQADVFASIAYYLSSSGWNGEEGWGRAVLLPKGYDVAHADIKVEKPLSEWAKAGIRKADGQALPAGHMNTSLAIVGTADDAKHYLVYGNYKVLLKWNRSRFFATAVGILADQIGQ